MAVGWIVMGYCMFLAVWDVIVLDVIATFRVSKIC